MIQFLKAAFSFARLEFKALKFYPTSFILALLQSFVGTGVWFFVSLFLQEYTGDVLSEYGGDFVVYMVIGVIFFHNASKIMQLPYKSLSAAYWDKRLEVYNSSSCGIWAFLMGHFIWGFWYDLVIQSGVFIFGVFVVGLQVSSTIPVLPAVVFYLLFIAICFGIGLIGASTFFSLEVKNGRDPVTWLTDVAARLFSGVYYPLSVLPASLLFVSKFIPHTYALQGIRLIIINGYGFQYPAVLKNCLVLLVFAVVLLTFGIISLNRALVNAEKGNGVGIVV